MSSDESDIEWEEVEVISPSIPVSSEPSEEQLLAAAIASRSGATGTGVSGSTLEITLGKDGRTRKGKSKEKDMFQKAFESFQKRLCQDIHKVHLLCLLALGLRRSQQCNDHTLQSLLLSLLSDTKDLLSDSSTRNTSDSVLKLLRWFVREGTSVESIVRQSVTEVGVFSVTQSLVALLRALGLRTRLVMVLDPRPYKTTPTKQKTSVSCADATQTKKVKGHHKQSKFPAGECISADPVEKVAKQNRALKLESKQSNKRAKPQGTRSCRSLCKSAGRTPENVAIEVATSSTTECSTSPYFKKKLRSESSLITGSELLTPRRSVTQEDNKRTKRKRSASWTMSPSDDDDFVPPKPASKRKLKTRRSTKKLRKFEDDLVTVSNTDTRSSPTTSNSNCEADTEQTGSDIKLTSIADTLSWAEVFSTVRKKWIPVHLPSCSVGQPQLCERDCPVPLDYVLAFENGTTERVIRDVTPRYASDWCSRVYKQRLDQGWWAETLQPFEPYSQQEKEDEDEEMTAFLLSQPLPTSVTDYKNHPLYVLKRHLLKFEVIYPEDSVVLGFCRREHVYSRQCVQTLHTRETWLKQARMIKVGETAHKVVKARPKRGVSLVRNQQRTVDVYGRWQTQDYIALPIVDGKVPRNEHGNVELFQPSMLPPGGTHVKIQGIQRVARKLEIDYAPAMLGWDFHSGYCHPIIEGIVIPKENKGILLEAWEQEEQIRIDKDSKKREKRVTERWRRLTRHLLIKQRLRLKYLDTE